jgi:hypothetical protein
MDAGMSVARNTVVHPTAKFGRSLLWTGRDAHGVLRALLLALALTFLPSAGGARAHASSQVLLLAPTQTDQPDQWTDMVRGLRATGTRVVQLAELSVDPVYAACRATDCAARLAPLAQVAVALFAIVPADASGPARLQLQLFQPDGGQIMLQTPLDERSRVEVASELFEAAQRQLSLGERALLRVNSVPLGAVVWIDGRPAGVTPFEHPEAAGAHALRVTLAQFHAEERRIDLARGAMSTLDVRLRYSGGASRTAGGLDAATRTTSPANFVLGGLLSLVALPALVAGINTLVNDGQCLESAADGCRERARFGVQSALLLSAGGVALLAGGYLLVAQPFGVEAEVSPTAARLQMRGRF